TVNVGAAIARLEAGGAAAAPVKAAAPKAAAPAKAAATAEAKQSPAVTVALAETGVDPANVQGTGKDGRLTKADVRGAATVPAPAAAATPAAGARQEERVRMTRLRQTIARRLKEAQNTAAMLTTFNDVDMTAVMEARDRYKD